MIVAIDIGSGRARVVHDLSLIEAFCESPRAIRRKATFDGPPIKRAGVVHENFFVAKMGDSESARRLLGPTLPIATTSSAHRSRAQ